MLANTPQVDSDFLNTFSELDLLRNNCPIVYFDGMLPRTMPDPNRNTSRAYKIEENVETLSIMKDEVSSEKWANAYNMFKRSFDSKASLFAETPFCIIDKYFRDSLQHIFSLSPAVVSTGASDDECIYIYAEIDNKKIFFNLFFEGDKTDVLLHMTENREPICLYDGLFDETINVLNKKLQKKPHDI